MENLRLADGFLQSTAIISDKTAQGNEALQLHFEIKASFSAAASAMVDFSRQLKTMRDQKLYEHIGFDSFESYVETAHGIKQRQAYTYIQTYERLQPSLMEQNSELGITKLALLCGVSAVEREDFAQENDLSGMTVEAIKRLIEEKNGLAEQISLLSEEKTESEEKQALRDRELEKLKTQLAEKDAKIENLQVQQQPIDVAAVDTDKLEAAIRQKELDLRVEFDKERAAFETEKKTLKKDKENAIKKAEEQAAAAAKQAAEANLKKTIENAKAAAQEETKKKMTAEFEKRQSELSGSVAAAQEQAKKLEKKLEIAGNQHTVKFNILFEQVQNDIFACLDIIETIKKNDEVTASKFETALKSVLGQIMGK